MIKANIDELFPVSVTLLDEETARLVSGQIVTYDVRTFDDVILSPPVSGTLAESAVEGGIYKTQISLPDAGTYICYVAAEGFFTNYEEIVVYEENAVEVAKRNYPHNLSVVDVVRTTAHDDRTPSQILRNVPFGKTDCITTFVKSDDDSDWNSPVASGTVFAWYESLESILPYMMGSEY